jgi:hypothetical protein
MNRSSRSAKAPEKSLSLFLYGDGRRGLCGALAARFEYTAGACLCLPDAYAAAQGRRQTTWQHERHDTGTLHVHRVVHIDTRFELTDVWPRNGLPSCHLPGNRSVDKVAREPAGVWIYTCDVLIWSPVTWIAATTEWYNWDDYKDNDQNRSWLNLLMFSNWWENTWL